MPTQTEKALAFRALHARPGAFVLPNPWDAGSTLLLNAFGFEALATTSAGHAFALGKRDTDGGVGRGATLANARAIVEATHLPVSADLENGFGDAPDACAETIRAASSVGLVGGSIEDASGDATRPIYDLAHATERVAAAVEAARSLPVPFVLTARAENFLHGRRTSTTPSAACRPSNRRERRCSMPPASPRSTRSAPSAPAFRDRSMS